MSTRFTAEQVAAYNSRQWSKGTASLNESLGEPCDRESKLREQIIAYSDRQWPRWKVVWARSDKKSTLPVGCQDLTLFADNERVFCIELKAKVGKQSPEQVAWSHEMLRLGHLIYIVRSFEDFMSVIGPEGKP